VSGLLLLGGKFTKQGNTESGPARAVRLGLAQVKQTDQPWKGNPEKEQRNGDEKLDLEKWHETNTH
jgi:hypothetical protein